MLRKTMIALLATVSVGLFTVDPLGQAELPGG